MATYNNLSALFTAIANAIRSKTGGTAAITANNFPTAIAGITSRQVGTATASRTSTTKISFSVSGNPVAFAMVNNHTAENTSSSAYMCTGIVWTGSTYYRQRLKMRASTAADVYVGTGNVSKSYSNGTLTLTISGDTLSGGGDYLLLYVY